MAKMPGAERAYVERAKIVDYLLNAEHSTGGPKAKFFQIFGFSRDQTVVFENELLDHARTGEVVGVRLARTGTVFEVTGPLSTPSGRLPTVLTVWEIDRFGRPRLVTAVPD